MNGNILKLPKNHKERFDLAAALAKSEPEKALVEANLLIAEGYWHAYTIVGLIYERQYDFAKALDAYKFGAETVGAVEAWLGVARISMCLSPPDYAEALACYQHLANEGNEMIAWLMLGVIYQQGYGVNVDFEISERCLKRAAVQGSVPASVHLARISSMNGRRVRGFIILTMARVKAMAIALDNIDDERLRDDSVVIATNRTQTRSGNRRIRLTAVK